MCIRDRIDDFDIEKESKLKKLEGKGLWFIKKDQLKKNYIEDIKNDLSVLKSIQKDWEILKNKNFKDPKTDAFKKIISNKFITEIFNLIPTRNIFIYFFVFVCNF